MTITQSSTRLAAMVAGGAVALSLVFGTAFAFPAQAAALTASQVSAIVSLLQSFGADAATIANVQASLTGQPTTGGTGSTTTTGGSCSTFTRDLQQGSTGADVMALQKFLNANGAQVAASGAGSPGYETSTFGPATKAALAKWQAANGVSPAAGYFGPLTRAKVSAMCGTTGSTTTTPVNTGSTLMVTAAAQPANGLAPASASRIPFTNFTVTAPASGSVTLNSVTVERQGVAVDANFSGVALIDASTGMQVGIAKTLNSNHQATIGAPIVIPAGMSKTFTVAANRASAGSHGGEIASFAVVAVNTSAAVSGSLPIVGASHTINETLTLGSVTIGTSSFDPNTAGSQPIGTTAYRFTGFRITAGSAEDLTFKSIAWNQSGSVSASDLANVVTVVNGTSYPTTVSADGKYFSTVFPSGIVIAKGNSVDVYIQGDIVGSSASGRYVEFDVYKNTDVYLVGNLYGYGVTAAVGSNSVNGTSSHTTTINTSSNPWLEGSTLAVTAGSVTTISKANEVAAQNIAVNVANQPLGGFATNFSGEPVSVQGLYFVISTTTSIQTSGASPYSAITNITLVDENGAVVAGPVDAALGSGTHGGATPSTSGYGLIHFTDSVTFPTGRHVYTLKGQIPSGWANSSTVTIYTKPSTDFTTPQGQTTGNTVSLSSLSSAFTMNQMTVKAASVSVNVSSQPAAQSIVPGVQGFNIAQYQIDASQSGEDIRLSAFPVKMTVGGAATASRFTGCQLWDGSTALNTGSRVINTWTDATAKTYSFDNSLTVAKGTVKTLSLKCDVSSSATTGTIIANYDNTNGDYSITGVISGNSVTVANGNLTLGTSNGNTMTLGSASLAVSVDASTPSYMLAAGGTTGVTAAVLKLRATNEAINLNKLGLALTNATASSTAADLTQVYLYAGNNIMTTSGSAIAAGTLLGTATFTGSNTIATSTLNTVAQLPKDTDATIVVKVDLADIGSSQSGTEGHLVIIDPSSAEGYGSSSGTTVRSGASTGAAGVRVFNTYPTLALDTLTTAGVTDGRLLRFKVTANSANAVGLYSMRFSLSTTSATVSNVGLYAYTDSSYSSPVSGLTSGQFGTNQTPTSTSIFAISQSTPVQVPAGSTYYFELRGTVSPSTTTYSVVTTLKGDSTFPNDVLTTGNLGFVAAAATIAGSAYNNFIWSPNATTTVGITANDWTNGYGVSGLPASGLIQSRTN